MKRGLRFVAIAVVATLTAGFSGAMWYGFSEPPVHRLPLAHELIDATSTEGKELLASSSAKVAYEELLPYFVAQSRRAYCGVATGSIVANAALHRQPFVTQETFFSSEASALRSEVAVTFSGLTLSQLAAILRNHGLDVQVVHATQDGLASFREVASATLAEPHQFLIVNYDRAALKQEGPGHISPVAAYNAASDRLLVLDVAAQKYPYTWVPLRELWDAMNTVDPQSGETRGFLLVRAYHAKQTAPGSTSVN
ncbi:phytochelatin synthase family protein [Dyella silvae]|uniref:phytochelatin synthase family protein n=1 Tax=Dyella silvae TaxID=2994424 RepID=UPI00226534B4|nr:phytochelatin synthase family protein [Dyella silvae]